MEQLEKLIYRLDTDSYCAVSLYTNTLEKPIYSNFTHQQIKEAFGDATTFFESIYKEGYSSIRVQEKRKNGINAFKIVGEPFEVHFETTERVTELQKQKKKKKKKKSKGLMGLGMSEIFDLKLQAHDKETIAKKLEIIEKENQELKAKNEALNQEKLERKYSQESNENFNAMLLGVVKQAPLILQGLGLQIPQGASGLGASINQSEQEEAELNPVASEFIEIVKTLDDDTITLLKAIWLKIHNQNEQDTFSTELFELLQKHKMIV